MVAVILLAISMIAIFYGIAWLIGSFVGGFIAGIVSTVSHHAINDRIISIAVLTSCSILSIWMIPYFHSIFGVIYHRLIDVDTAGGNK